MMAPIRSLFYAFGRVTIYALAPMYHAARVCPSAVADPPSSSLHFTLENAFEPRLLDLDLHTKPDLHFRHIAQTSARKRKAEPMAALVLPARREPFFSGDEDFNTFRYVVSGLHARGALPWIKQLKCAGDGAEPADACSAIGHGASTAIPKELEAVGVHVPPETLVRHLSIEQMAAITRAFMRWPFHPDVRWARAASLTAQPIDVTLQPEEFLAGEGRWDP